MWATVKPWDMTKNMEQVEMRLKASMCRNVNLPLSSMSSVAGESASGPSEPKKRGSTSWIKHSIKRRDMN